MGEVIDLFSKDEKGTSLKEWVEGVLGLLEEQTLDIPPIIRDLIEFLDCDTVREECPEMNCIGFYISPYENDQIGGIVSIETVLRQSDIIQFGGKDHTKILQIEWDYVEDEPAGDYNAVDPLLGIVDYLKSFPDDITLLERFVISIKILETLIKCPGMKVIYYGLCGEYNGLFGTKVFYHEETDKGWLQVLFRTDLLPFLLDGLAIDFQKRKT